MEASFLQAASRLADEVLFPSALITDRSDRVPRSHFDRLAEAGLYGLLGPAEAGGLNADQAAALSVIEVLAGGCLTTTFVWLHHHAAFRAIAASSTPGLRDHWLEPMCLGQSRAGVALGGILPGGAGVSAGPVEGGWRFDGSVPWVTGWGLVDVIHIAARSADGDIVWALIDPVETSTLSCQRRQLAAIHASVTVSVEFHDHFVPAERVTAIQSYAEWSSPGSHGSHYQAALAASLALGLVGRCCRLLGPGPLDQELLSARSALDRAARSHRDALPAARAAASHLAVRAAAALVVAGGSRSILLDEHPQRLAREATFLLVFGSRPPIPAELTRLFVSPK